MSSEIIVSTKKAKAIKPPLKKSEIVEALARRKFSLLVEASNEYKARVAKLEQRINVGITKLTAQGGTTTHRWDTARVDGTEYFVPGQKWGCSAYNRTSIKIDHPDKKSAMTAINRRTHGHQRNRPRHLRAYPCRQCNGWHLTHEEDRNA